MAGLSINEITTFRWTFDEDVQNYKAAGIEAMGVWRQKLADYGEEKGAELLRAQEMRVSNLLWAGGFTGSDGHSYHEAVADAKDAIHLAQALGSPCLVLYSGSRNGHTLSHARRLFATALRELLPVAADAGITLAIEPMHVGCAEDWTFLTSLDEALALIDSLGSPYLKLAYDTYHLGHDPQNAARIGQIASHIAIVHLADGKCPPNHEQNRNCLGEGSLPLACMVGALHKAGYRGYYDVELIGEDIESRDYRSLLDSSRKVFGQWLRNA